MDVSVIFPTFNNAAMLASTLASFEGVQFPDAAELIVVDNNSTDDTADTVNRFSERLPVQYAFEPKQGISPAKNRGAALARGKLLIFTDDDVRPDPAWITIYLSAYRRNPQGFFWGGPVVSEFGGPMPDERLLQIAPPSVRGLNLGARERVLATGEWFIGANWACASETFSSVGPFDDSKGLNPAAGAILVGEETDLQNRFKDAGYAALYLPTASLCHVVPARKCTLEHVASRAEAYGRYLGGIAPVERGTRTLWGVSLWRYRKCFESWGRAWLKRTCGRDWYPDYKEYRVARGVIRCMAGRAGCRTG